MARVSFAGFKDPVRRPRYIVWLGTVVILVAGLAVTMAGVVSSRWFCADACHKVQDDTIISYSHSPHSKISCNACHMPVNADTITFVIHKIEGALGIIPTVRNTYELPLNPESEYALSKYRMPEEQCTQCHSPKTRVFTPSQGIIIDHAVHSKAGYQCTVCHNRVAHVEDFALTLPGNEKHADFMTMDACFRCHDLAADAKAPGQCNACHPKDFVLRPAYHTELGFYPKGHAELAKEEESKVAEAEAVQKELETPEAKAKAERLQVVELPLTGSVHTCYTCHRKAQFCDSCHGMEMPHPAEFKEPADPKDPNGHPAMSKAPKTASRCEFCHHQSKTFFCDGCHHGTKIGWEFDRKVPWVVPRVGVPQQHPRAVKAQGTTGCFECHKEAFCSYCHVRASAK